MKVALVFSQYGPYHHARAAALREVLGEEHFMAVQIAAQSKTYAWTVQEQRLQALTTLCDGAEEDAGFLKVFAAAWRFWRREKVTAAFIPSYFPAGSLALLLSAKLAGVKCIMMNESHAGTERASGIKRRVKRFLVSLFDAALVGGQPQKRHFEVLGLPAAKIFTGYDAIDNSYFATSAAVAVADREANVLRLGLPPRYFLSLGRFVTKKNLPTLIRAYRDFCARSQENVALVLVGSGAEEALLRGLVTELGLTLRDQGAGEPAKNAQPVSSAVYFMGFRQLEENPIFYALAEAFILPSIEEEWGLVVNEAMACGLPVVVSKTVGCAEDLVEHRSNGWLFDPGDVAALADHLVNLAENPASREAMSVASRIRIAKWDCPNFASNATRALASLTK